MKKIKVGYLPLFVKLYDDDDPHYRDPLFQYTKKLVGMLEEQGLEVVLTDEICRIECEFEKAVDKFNSLGVDAVITQHLAYSPSLEAIGSLLKLKMPIIVFDTTVDCAFFDLADSKNLMRANHGIHGVQDMCNMLTRNERRYWLCVGHVDNSNIIEDVVSKCRAAKAANTFKNAKIGSVAGSFKGMGDFSVTDERYKAEIGAEIIHMSPIDAEKYVSEVTDEEIISEIEKDKKSFLKKSNNDVAYREETRWGLALRKWITDKKLDGASVNFLNLTESGFKVMPFIECSKMLSNKKGYAGEGDTLTAGLVSAMFSIYDETTFVEMFCPDWKENLIFFSHMGEMNPSLAQWTPSLVDCPMGGETGDDTVYVIGCAKPGKAVYVNLAPMNKGFRLIVSDVEMLDIGKQGNIYDNSRNQGWMKPRKPLTDFLKDFSYAGGTHHSALVYGGDINTIKTFGEMMSFDVVEI